MLLKIETVIYW